MSVNGPVDPARNWNLTVEMPEPASVAEAASATAGPPTIGASGEPTEFQWPANGAAVEASTWTKLDEPTVFTSNDTPPFGRPIPAVTSCATAARSIIPPSTAFAVGEVTDALSGEALSTVF